MSLELLTPDTQAILLLCGNFGIESAQEGSPLTPSEYGDLAQWLVEKKLRPADLLESANESILNSYQSKSKKVKPEQLKWLLNRGGAMALAVEKWVNRGLWIISRSDRQYPRRLKEKFKHTAPPILYGVGNPDLLNNGGLGVVGSRNAGVAELDFTCEIAAICADAGIQVISGGARGVDGTAMLKTTSLGGTVVGVLASDLLRNAVSKDYRDTLKNGSLVLISPVNPEAGFSVGNAMGRNRYIYALSDATLVVDSASNGGTWSGAIENLKQQWVPLLVRTGDAVSEGNKRLIEMGAHPITLEDFAPPKNIKQWFASLQTMPLLRPPSTTPADGLFEVVWPHLAQALAQSQTAVELAQSLNLHLPQTEAWLNRAVKEGKAEQTAGRYSVISTTPQQLSLLG